MEKFWGVANGRSNGSMPRPPPRLAATSHHTRPFIQRSLLSSTATTIDLRSHLLAHNSPIFLPLPSGKPYHRVFSQPPLFQSLSFSQNLALILRESKMPQADVA
ncbi:hypothetical protein HPP92_014562 [Vanilla planifolia]|uniref:Uncharacterized protein n=1 Tax=Vanilla planifolia TaxID=51239 RepID=A0A835QK86_VANPL|nr:hypothetical protein HPP92_014562 [Vanilla planifolia]